jgi:hypothetical protein
VTTEQILALGQQALQTFERDLRGLWAERPRQWVAYRGEKRLGFALHKHELYQQCLQQGLALDEFVVFCIEPQETEMLINPAVLD